MFDMCFFGLDFSCCFSCCFSCFSCHYETTRISIAAWTWAATKRSRNSSNAETRLPLISTIWSPTNLVQNQNMSEENVRYVILSKYFKTSWNIMKYHEISWNILKSTTLTSQYQENISGACHPWSATSSLQKPTTDVPCSKRPNVPSWKRWNHWNNIEKIYIYTVYIYIYIETYWNIGKILEGNANRILQWNPKLTKIKVRATVKFEKHICRQHSGSCHRENWLSVPISGASTVVTLVQL